MSDPVSKTTEIEALKADIATYVETSAAQATEIERLRVAAVKAVMPLEVLRMSGWQPKFTPEVQQAIDEGITAVRRAISHV